MANHYFQFKQFTVQQDKCAMKVCTDACLFGAWVAHQTAIKSGRALDILDIGTGTGLLSLMLAQKTAGQIDAIEINEPAALQAGENIRQSAWADKVKVIHASLQDFIPSKKYDLIISNPPFYQDDLRSADEDKNAAKHDSTLKLDQLLPFMKANLSGAGVAAVLLPYHRLMYAEKEAKKAGLYIEEKLLVKQTPAHEYFRAGLLLSNDENANPAIQSITIHTAERAYTPAFELLLKDYYLRF